MVSQVQKSGGGAFIILQDTVVCSYTVYILHFQRQRGFIMGLKWNVEAIVISNYAVVFKGPNLNC